MEILTRKDFVFQAAYGICNVHYKINYHHQRAQRSLPALFNANQFPNSVHFIICTNGYRTSYFSLLLKQIFIFLK